MRTGAAIVIATLLACGPCAVSAQVYKCKTAQGTTFSQTPCAPDAESIKVRGMKSSAGTTAATAAVNDAPEGAASVDLDTNWPDTTDEAIALLGRPQGVYYEEDDEYWLYALGCRASDRNCPELRVVDGKVMQINWYPESVMRKSIAVTAGFAGFTPNRNPRDKPFTLDGAAVQGQSREMVAAKLGPPDYKRAFRGIEVWEYRKVRVGAQDTRQLTLFLEFDGPRVTQVIGN